MKKQLPADIAQKPYSFGNYYKAFKVYKRKIHVHYRSELTNGLWMYMHSTNAHRTCKEAEAAARELYPHLEVKANFAKD